jgi:hypothetical protein
VDAGLGRFMDAATAKLLVERMESFETADGNYYDDVLRAELDAKDPHRVDHHPVASRAEYSSSSLSLARRSMFALRASSL